MIVVKTKVSDVKFKDVFIFVKNFAPQSANRILMIDMVSTFFAFKKVIPNCRSPPSVNLDLKNLN